MERSAANFGVAYDGAAIVDGAMEVRDIAPALLALHELIFESNARLNGDLATVSVKINSEFRRGSWEASIVVVLALQAARDLLMSDAIPVADRLLKAIGLAGKALSGLLQLLKKLGGKQAERRELPDGRFLFYINNSNVEITVEREVANLYDDAPVRNALQRVLKPLEKKGIDKFKVISQEEVVEIIEKSDLPSFDPPAETAPVSEATNEFDTYLEVERPAFRDKLTWHFSDGTGSFSATVRDQDFLENVERGESFSKGHVLKVTLRRAVQVDGRGSLHTKNEIVRVLESRPRPRQARINYGSPAPTAPAADPQDSD